MGKSWHDHHHHRPESSGIPLDQDHNHSPGCMSGILHHFHNQRRHHLKKRLPHRKIVAPKRNPVIADEESIKTTSETAEPQQTMDPDYANHSGETKSKELSTTPKSSMKSRIKALISEEMSKRKGRHRRSSSDPPVRTQHLERSDSIRHLEPSNCHPESPSLDCSNHNVNPIALLDPLLPKNVQEHGRTESSCDFCMLNYLKQSEVSKKWHQPVRDHTLIEDRSIYAIEPSKYNSIQESKLFLDALNLLNMRREVFLKILQDPSSSLARQLHGRRTSSLRSGLTKSVSFPVPGRGIKPDKSKPKHKNTSYSKEDDEVQYPLFLGNSEILRDQDFTESSSPDSAIMLRKQQENKVALKGFKNLRDKIMHVIREKKKEKHRIVMDAVLHKVPYGRTVSKDREDGSTKLKTDKFSKNSPQSSCGSETGSDLNNSWKRDFKRTSSFHESSEMYNRLLDTGYNRGEEQQHHVSNRLRSKASDTPSPIPSLARILSLPDLRSYSYFQMEDSPTNSSFDNSARNSSVGSKRPSEHKPLGVGLETKRSQMFYLSESGSQDNFLDAGETLDDSADSRTWESESCYDSVLESGQASAYQSSKSDMTSSETDSFHEEDKVGLQRFVEPVSQGTTQDWSNFDADIASKEEIEAIETQSKKFYEELLRVQVDIENEAEFNYVKDILELSGFSGNEILGKWHSAEYPVNPSVFEEVEGCLLAQLDCVGNEEGGSCDHLLLFDLINEALLSIYEKSFCYWPNALSCRSHLHRMPIGQHVLEEVWSEISLFLRWRPEFDQTIDDVVVRDLAKGDGWMNLQFDAECVGIELEDFIFNELLEEICLSS